jgi:L-rhamnonate dehydratase
MKIVSIETHFIPVSMWADLWEREKDLPLVTPLSIYPEYKESYPAWYWNPAMTVVVLTTDDGTEGIGWSEDGTRAVQVIIDEHLERFVVGASPFDHERVWDIMFRSSIPYGRKGAAIEAISAIDIAMWDLMGKAEGKPVYELLGGKRESMALYASALHPVAEEKVRAEAAAFVADGYRTVKGRFPSGPADGEAGKQANVDHIRVIREAVGPDIGVACDAYMGWDAEYAIDMVKLLEPFDMAWLEEPVIPDDINGYARIRAASNIPISGGEHEFTRFGHQQLLDAGAVDILQPDLHRCGGFTDAMKIGALAAAQGLPIICHTYSVPHLHFSIAAENCSILEHFPAPCWFEMAEPPAPLFIGEPAVVNGAVTPSTEPGLGLQLDRERLAELMGSRA